MSKTGNGHCARSRDSPACAQEETSGHYVEEEPHLSMQLRVSSGLTPENLDEGLVGLECVDILRTIVPTVRECDCGCARQIKSWRDVSLRKERFQFDEKTLNRLFGIIRAQQGPPEAVLLFRGNAPVVTRRSDATSL